MRIFTTIVFNFLLAMTALGQSYSARNLGPVMTVNISYAYQLPAGDLVDRFGNNFNAGGGVDFLTRNNFIVGAQANYIFGNEVKEVLTTDLERALATGENAIYGNALVGEPSSYQLKQRGFYVGGHIGKLFPISPDNKRSGIRVTVGAGYLQHKIRVQDDPQAFVPVLGGAYKEGWDKLTSGLGITEFVGYQLLSKNRLLNIAFGLEFTQGFTRGKRDYDFQTRNTEISHPRRKDHLVGLRLNWSLPLYFEGEAQEIYY